MLIRWLHQLKENKEKILKNLEVERAGRLSAANNGGLTWDQVQTLYKEAREIKIRAKRISRMWPILIFLVSALTSFFKIVKKFFGVIGKEIDMVIKINNLSEELVMIHWGLVGIDKEDPAKLTLERRKKEIERKLKVVQGLSEPTDLTPPQTFS